MAIRKEQPGAAKAAAAAGTVIGAAAREKEDRARVEREQARADQEAAQRQARQTAMKWDLQKMQLRSQQEFEQELRTTQYGLDRFNRAKEWDIEKMELRSRMDFQQEEEERLRKKGVVAAKRAGVEKDIASRQSDRKEYELILFNLDQEDRAIDLGTNIPAPATEMPGESAAEQRAASRETRAEGAAQRAASAEQRAIAGAPTPEEIEREKYENFLGDWAKALSLPELKTEAQSEGFAPQQQSVTPSNIPYPTPNSQAAYDAIPSGSTYIDSAGNERTKS